MASSRHKPLCKGPVKKIVLQELLNFSGSSDDEQNLSDPSEKPARQTQTAKQGDDKHCSQHAEKENIAKKPAVNTVNKEEVVTRGGHASSESKNVDVNSIESDSNAKTVGSLALQKETAGAQAEKKKKSLCGKPRPKTSAQLQNKTLADFVGISFDFSDNSDSEEEEKSEKESRQLKTNLDIFRKGKERAKDSRKVAGVLQLNLQSPDKHEDDADEHCKPNAQLEKDVAAASKALSSIDICGHKTKTSAARKPFSLADEQHSFKDLGSKLSASNHRTEKEKAAEATITSVKSKTEHLKNPLESPGANDLKSDTKSGKKWLPWLHLKDVSVISSAVCSDNLIVFVSPSEESLLPLSESTRLECPESARTTKQSFGHLLAHQNSPQLFESSLGDSQNSSYEQLKIVVKKDAEKLLMEENQAWSEKEQKSQGLGGAETLSGLETSEGESQYLTCLATPDVSSMYEAVDVSVQTSFKLGVSPTTDTAGTRAVSSDSPVIRCSGDSLTNTGTTSANADSSEQYIDSEGGAEAVENTAVHVKTAVDLAKSVNLKATSQPVLSPKVESCDEDDELPDLSPDVCFKRNEKDVKEIQGTAKSCKGQETTDPILFHSREMRPKLSSDSNYFSETCSDINNTSDSLGVKRITNEHKTRTALPESEKLLGSIKVDCTVTEEEERTSAGQETCEGENTAGRASQQLASPETSSLSCHKPKSGLDEEKMPRSSVRRSPKQHEDSSSEDDSDGKLEAFLQKMRTSAQPSKKAAAASEDLGDFIVNDSDVTDSDEDVSDKDADPMESLCDDVLLEPRPQTHSARREVFQADSRQETTACEGVSGSDDNDDDDDYADAVSDADDVEEDDEDNGFIQELKTPRSKMIPSFSRSQTPREASPKWYTPATSWKTRPRHRMETPLDVTTLTSSSTRGQGKADRGGNSWQTPASGLSQAANRLPTKPLSFLRSLSSQTPDHLRDGEARGYILHFKRKQEELSSRLFKLFNFTVFENQLPADLPVVWNKRLLKTAGLCKLKRVNDRYTAVIELSSKVCDTAERVRDTLVHEMCHAAVWILNRAKEGHGPHWKYWASKANRAHPEIPVIRRCHDYSINTKYIYRCEKCGYQIGRHSKSLDTERKVCGRCRGRFQLLPSSSRAPSTSTSLLATPRTPNPFALFVKENYGSVKRGGGGLPHKEVMEALSKEFAKTKINFS